MSKFSEMEAQNKDFLKLKEKREALAQDKADARYYKAAATLRETLGKDPQLFNALNELLGSGYKDNDLRAFMRDEYCGKFVFECYHSGERVYPETADYEAAEKELGLQ